MDTRLQVANRLASDLSVSVGDLPGRWQEMQQKLQATERELKILKSKIAAEQAQDVSQSAKTVGKLQVLATVVEAGSPDELRQLAASIASKLTHPLVLAGAEINGKASVVALAGPEAIAAGFKAGEIIRQITIALEGKGGGKPDFAMGGGTRPDLLPSTLTQWLNNLG
ncbi:MAG: DHHA1 domain-containing protein [Verrucomicrobia bacterium]|nr:DHHA1 domain-containing protein [Verrucomicrobiota bacterium]